ncbi:MAG: CHAT domain-containing protein [Piscinibacter sp.]
MPRDEDEGPDRAFDDELERDPIGTARALAEMVRMQSAMAKPSIEMVSHFTSSVQLSLAVNAVDVAVETLPLLLQTFSNAHDLHVSHTDPLSRLAKAFERIDQFEAQASILNTVVEVRRRFLGHRHSGTWIAQAELADALRRARRYDRARHEIESAIEAWETSDQARIENDTRAAMDALLHSHAGVIAQEARDDARALKHLGLAFHAESSATAPLNRCITALNYARSLIRTGSAPEAARILSTQVPKLAAIELEESQSHRLRTVAGVVASELAELGFSQLAMALSEAAGGKTSSTPRPEDLQAVVNTLLIEARALKHAGRLNDSAAKYEQCLQALDGSGELKARRLRAIVLDNALGLFCLRYGITQIRGVVGDHEPIGNFDETDLIDRTRAAFEDAYEPNDIHIAVFFGNLGTLQSMKGQAAEAEIAYDHAMKILDTHPPGDPEIASTRRRLEIERANMRRIHSGDVEVSTEERLDVERLRELDGELARANGPFSPQRINQLSLWSSQLFHDDQAGAAFEFSQLAVVAAKEYLQHVSAHAAQGGQSMVAYQPQMINGAFRTQLNYLSLVARRDASVKLLERVYALIQLEMSSSVSAAFALARGAQLAAHAVLAEERTILATQEVLQDQEYLVVIANTEYLLAIVIGHATARVVPLNVHFMALGFRESIRDSTLRDIFDTDDPMMMTSLSRNVMPLLVPHVPGAKHVIFATGAALSGLPLGLLRWPSDAGDLDESSPRLLDRVAMSVVPSVSSLIDSRTQPVPSQATYPFLGIAHPDLGDSIPPVSDDTLDQLFYRMGADGDLRTLPELPQTARMVRSIAASLGAQPDVSLRLGTRASRKEVLELNASGELRRYRIVCFATHGLTAQELRTHGIEEPALLLASPGWVSALDSGNGEAIRASLLTMQDAMSLRLDADLVMLTACNTAASDGEQHADALTGLAASFIQAGARSVLVSYWAADAEATEVFVEHLFSPANRVLPRAEAIRRAMLTTRDEAGGRFSKPAFWCAFVLVGDGAAPLLTN